jgi:hypothetical protein
MAIGTCRIDSNKRIVELQRDWLQQGWVFKDADAFEYRPTAPCYVPELFDIAYSKEDLLALCDNQEDIAKEVFHLLNWQSPEALLDEEFTEGELTLCKHCSRMFKSYWTSKCPHCGNAHDE